MHQVRLRDDVVPRSVDRLHDDNEREVGLSRVRLEDAVSLTDTVLARTKRALDEARAEVERLREALADAERHAQAKYRERGRDRQAIEIERLRAELAAERAAHLATRQELSMALAQRHVLVEVAVRATIEEAALQAGDYIEDADLCGVPCRDEVSAIDAHLRNIDPAPIVARVLGGGE